MARYLARLRRAATHRPLLNQSILEACVQESDGMLTECRDKTYMKPTPNMVDSKSFLLSVKLSLHSCGIGIRAIIKSELMLAAAAK